MVSWKVCALSIKIDWPQKQPAWMYPQSSYIFLSSYRISARSHIEAAIVRFDKAFWKEGKCAGLPIPPAFLRVIIAFGRKAGYDRKASC
ncbi:MAG TPA: hypothetical protein VI385_06500 [Flavisolibacter sp.]